MSIQALAPVSSGLETLSKQVVSTALPSSLGQIVEKQLNKEPRETLNSVLLKNVKEMKVEQVAMCLYLFAAILLITYAGSKILPKLLEALENGGVPKERSPATQLLEEQKLKFNDIAGLHGPKKKFERLVKILKNFEAHVAAKKPIPKGYLFVGPPGTGKTMMAKVLAGEANVPFHYLSGSSLDDKYIGTGASRVRALFKEAAKQTPCIIFIDEIDALANRSDQFRGRVGDSTVTELLTQLDGIGSKKGIIVIAATNTAASLDDGLKRSGRLGNTIEFTFPNEEERMEILEVHNREIGLSQATLLEVAKQTFNFSGADLKEVLDQAVLDADSQDADSEGVTPPSLSQVNEAIKSVKQSKANAKKSYLRY
jgi:cell division protease FtsH